MKKKLLIILSALLITISLTDLCFAAISPTPTEEDQEATTTTINNQLDELKEKIASKVAQLKLTEKRGIIGTVTESTSTQITVLDLENEQRFIDVDELTKFSAEKDDSFGVSDIKKGDILGALGIYNKQSRRILAREINIATIPVFINGIVSDIDDEEYVLTVATDKQEEKTIDIETITKTFSYNSDSGLSKSGFSKITQGETILLVGYKNKTEKDRITASRIILFPEFPKDPMITIAPEALDKNVTITPSTGSGKKLTPIIKN